MPIIHPKPGSEALRTTTTLPNMIFIKNADVPLRDGGLCRANIYLPLAQGRYPVIMTLGPYGKDYPYSEFHVESYTQIPDEQKSEYSAWETPHPDGIRIDERGIGSSPGFLNTMSDQTSSDFAECIEWAADQDWSSGKIGLLGIFYFDGTQWRVAARKPKGMTDYYRDLVRQGGILSDQFIEFWWDRQVATMQYGNGEKVVRTWGPKSALGKPCGPECLEGVLSHQELVALRYDQTIDNREHRYLDEPYHSSRTYDLGDIEVPTLSNANLGGIALHLRGNVVGYLEAGTKKKWLWFISGRHDLPFYLPHYMALQKSCTSHLAIFRRQKCVNADVDYSPSTRAILDAWLKGEDDRGWTEGPNVKVPVVNLLVREGNPGFNSNEAEATYKSREETS